MAISKRPMRRSALISPWGVGAIVPFPNDESLMIAGLDMWRYNNSEPFKIEDERLEKRLGVEEFRWPPDFRDKTADSENANLRIPTVRFPTWMYCPFCGTMRKVTYYSDGEIPQCDCYQWPTGRTCNSRAKYKKKLVPERFVVVCPDGHIDDFPVAEWCHQDEGYRYDEKKCRIRRSTGGTSSSLAGVTYTCSCGAKKSMLGAMTPGALKRIGYSCKASKPWLGIEVDMEYPCTREAKELKVVLRGASNVWFANTCSSITIPTSASTTSLKILGLVNQYYDIVRINDEWNIIVINQLAQVYKVDKDELLQAFIDREQRESGVNDITEGMNEDEYRLSEYKELRKNSGSDGQNFHSINYPISEYNPIIRKYFNSISLVPILRETRAFVGFNRVTPQNIPVKELKKMLRLGDENWLPAIQVFGEGIFFEFNQNSLSSWANQPEVKKRIAKLNVAYKNSVFCKETEGELRPEYVLIHTFAHLLINQLSFECGYGSSSIRERIYCEKTTNKTKMCGVLIYTASGDAEGSLGGLVRQGETGRLEDTIKDAVQNAMWCTSDPICIQSSGQGPESTNLAACHNCALLPETCCETGNRLLDRGVVIGTLDNRSIGYFSELCNLGSDAI